MGGRAAKFADAVGAQRDSFDLALDQFAMGPVEEAFEDEADDLIADTFRELGDDGSLTPAMVAALLAFLTDRAVRLAAAVGKALLDSARDTMAESLRSLNEFIKRIMEGKLTPLDDDAVVRRILELRRAQIAAMRQATAASFGLGVNQRLREVLLRAPPEITPSQAVAMVGDSIDAEWWRVERIVVTETAFAYNEAQADGMAELRRDPALRGLLMRWTEKISDAGIPLDKKVAPDSIAMHAQVAPPGGSFIMPPDAAGSKISGSLLHRSWPFPPNRPHDRAVLTPWLPGSGQPAWMWRDGRKDMS